MRQAFSGSSVDDVARGRVSRHHSSSLSACRHFVIIFFMASGIILLVVASVFLVLEFGSCFGVVLLSKLRKLAFVCFGMILCVFGILLVLVLGRLALSTVFFSALLEYCLTSLCCCAGLFIGVVFKEANATWIRNVDAKTGNSAKISKQRKIKNNVNISTVMNVNTKTTNMGK